MTWLDTKDQRDANGNLTPLALALFAIEDNGCDCGTDEPGTCLACLCEAALRDLHERLPMTWQLGPMPPRIIFTGGRDFKDEAHVGRVLDMLYKRFPGFTAVVGDCPTGADQLVARLHLGRSYVYRADWEQYGKAAGPLRNQAMVDGGAVLCVAFPGGRGTADCVKRARKAGIPVFFEWPNERLPNG